MHVPTLFHGANPQNPCICAHQPQWPLFCWWVPTTPFPIDTKSIFCGKPCQSRHTFEIFDFSQWAHTHTTHYAVTWGDHLHTFAHPCAPSAHPPCTFCTPLHTLAPHFPGLVTLTQPSIDLGPLQLSMAIQPSAIQAQHPPQTSVEQVQSLWPPYHPPIPC